MNIIPIGSDHSERLERFMLESKSHVHWVLPGKINLDEVVQGIVYFDDGKRKLSETLLHIFEQVRFLGAPLILVAEADRIGNPDSLRSTGASWICTPETSDAEILKAIQARCDTYPVEQPIHDQLLDPLVTAVRAAFGEMAHTELMVRAAYEKKHPVMLGDIAAVLQLQSTLTEALVLDITQTTALSIARRVLNEVAHVTDRAIVYDCMGEIANVIAGQAKALLAATPFHFTFSTPIIHATTLRPTSLLANGSLVVVFGSDVGEFAIQVCRRT